MSDNQNKPLLEVRNLCKYFDINTGLFKTKPLKAVDGVSFEIKDGEILDIQYEKIEAKIPQVSIKFPSVDGKEIPEFPMKLDFRFRDLLSAAGKKADVF